MMTTIMLLSPTQRPSHTSSLSCAHEFSCRRKPLQGTASTLAGAWSPLSTVALLLAVVAATGTVAGASSPFDNLDSYYTTVAIQAGTAYFNATASFSAATLAAASADVCSPLLAALPSSSSTQALAKRCFVTYDLSPLLVAHVVVATNNLNASYPVYATLTGWSSTSSVAGISTIRTKVFQYFGVPSAETTVSSVSTTIPCRSVFTVPTATPAPTLPPYVCSQNVSNIPAAQDVVLLTSVTVTTVSVQTALCDSLGATVCGTIAVVSTNVVNAQYALYATTIRFPASLSQQSRYVLSLVNSVRAQLYATLNLLAVRRILLVAPAGVVVASTGGGVTVYSSSETVSPNSPPATILCNPFYDYWTLILIVLGPTAYIVFRQAYHSGKRKGIKLEKVVIREEEEIREAQQAGGVPATMDDPEAAAFATQQQQQQEYRYAEQGQEMQLDPQSYGGGGAGMTPQQYQQWLAAAAAYQQQQQQQQFAASAPATPQQPLQQQQQQQWDPATLAYLQQMQQYAALQQQQQQQQQQHRR